MKLYFIHIHNGMQDVREKRKCIFTFKLRSNVHITLTPFNV